MKREKNLQLVHYRKGRSSRARGTRDNRCIEEVGRAAPKRAKGRNLVSFVHSKIPRKKKSEKREKTGGGVAVSASSQKTKRVGRGSQVPNIRRPESGGWRFRGGVVKKESPGCKLFPLRMP